MQTLFAVLDDLFQFARTALFGVQFSLPQRSDPLLLNGMQHMLPLRDTAGSAPLSLPPFQTSIEQSGTLYFVGGEHVPIHTDPVMAFDVIRALIPYGEQVRLLKLGGRWAFVKWNDMEGWIFKDVLRDQAKDVFPVFVEGVMYDALNDETKKLRLCIHDAFCGDRASLILTDAEYVTYKLHQKEYTLPWAQERPRTPGTWQKKLRGRKGVHIGINPQTNSVMEYVVDDVGFVAYVEAVFPDDTIKVSGIGLVEDGMYSETMLTYEAWRELRPVFISVT